MTTWRLPTRWAIAGTVVAILATMAACAAPAPAPGPEPSTDVASPTVPSAEPESAISAIAAAADSLVLRDEGDVVIASFDYYDDDAGTVVDALTDVFGEAAAVEEVPGSQETVPATRHTWGDFTLVEQRYVDGWDRDGLVPTRAPSFVVELTGSAVDGVELSTADGRSVGQPWSELQADPAFLIAGECAHAYTESVEREVIWYDGSQRVERIVVDLVPSDDADSLGIVRAPVVDTGCV